MDFCLFISPPGFALASRSLSLIPLSFSRERYISSRFPFLSLSFFRASTRHPFCGREYLRANSRAVCQCSFKFRSRPFCSVTNAVNMFKSHWGWFIFRMRILVLCPALSCNVARTKRQTRKGIFDYILYLRCSCFGDPSPSKKIIRIIILFSYFLFHCSYYFILSFFFIF